MDNTVLTKKVAEGKHREEGVVLLEDATREVLQQSSLFLSL
jgi:hypothetical protein